MDVQKALNKSNEIYYKAMCNVKLHEQGQG